MDEIRAPRREETEVLKDFFNEVIEDTIAREGIEIPYFLEEEVEDKMSLLKEYFSRGDEERVFLVAWHRGRVAGTISYAPCNDAILDIVGRDLAEGGEIGTVYVHPKYQKMGMGTTLFNTMCLKLLEREINGFYLDSGYRRAQGYWKMRLGEPLKVARDYWDKGADHMVWYGELKD